MKTFSLVLKNCNLVNENSIEQVDIGIKDDRIEKIAKEIRDDSSQIIDLAGRYLALSLVHI